MAQLSRSSLLALYGSSGTQFPDNTSKLITPSVMRTFGQNDIDSFFNLTDDAFSGASGLRLSITDTTGLKAIATISLLTDVMVFYRDSSGSLYSYKLVSGIDAESLPNVVRPNDFDATTNQKVWKIANSVVTGSVTITSNNRVVQFVAFQNQGYNFLATKNSTGGVYTKLIIQAATGISGDINGDEVVINAGAGWSGGNGNGGNVTINAGANSGSGTSGIIVLGSVTKYSGTNTTGSGTALLGSNCPASTLTAPYTWFKMQSSDGSTVYLPAWK